MDRFGCVCKNRRPLVFDAQHLGNAGAVVEVKIEQAYLFAVVGESEGEVHRECGFPHTTLPAQDENDVLHIDLCFRGLRRGGILRLC